MRTYADRWRIDPAKVGVLGFSAGGYLAIDAAVSDDDGPNGAPDLVDGASSRPNFFGAVYPAVPEGVEDHITEATPPGFLVHAGDDRLSADNSLGVCQAMRKVGVPAELHLYAAGGHAFGLGVRGGPVASWPGRFADWLRAMGILKG